MPWNPLLAVGVEEIDKQHMSWFEKADQLFEAGKTQKSAEFIGELLNFLDDYTKKHFRDEEAYMLSVNYPGYAEQKQLHTAFLENLKKLKADYAQSGGNILVILGANQLVVDWLIKHISTVDKRLGEYAKTVGK